MFDRDAFVAECRAALAESEPRRAIKEIVEREVSAPGRLAAALPPERAGITPLHVSPELTVLQVVWGPGMTLGPHDHRMWATIGIYTGGEDNAFYRRAGTTITPSGGKELRVGDVCLLGDDTVHAVTNPTAEHTGAIHIYGGDFFATPRSEWRGEDLQEEPFDIDRVLEVFEASNRALTDG
jgi:predicted metal-dependent enzyme (double-stranded beta helix superfamily)